MSCQNTECEEFSSCNMGCKILNDKHARKLCKHYKPPTSKLREAYTEYLETKGIDPVEWSALLNAIVHSIDELQENIK